MYRKILVTAGSTTVPIDQVRAITNIFSGRTGTEIAKHFAEHEDQVTLITSKADLLDGYHKAPIKVVPYRTFDQLKGAMEDEITARRYDMIIHSAAVSDYKVDGAYVMTDYDEQGSPEGSFTYAFLSKIDKAKKISSRHNELFLRMVPTPKIVDYIRRDWKFKGTLVKFKLEVGLTDEELVKVAAKSRDDSQADFIIANCLEWMGARAFIIDKKDNKWEVFRKNLPAEMFRRIA